MEQPLVSVLMTVYNREKFIAEAIESVLAQTYQNWELIITDDQSKDNSVAIARSYADKDERIHLYINEKNLGDYPNRNQAASYAKGKYLKYLDADDLMYPWALDCLVSMMEQNPEAKWGLCSLAPDRSRIYPFVLSPEEAYRHNYFKSSLFHKAPLSAIITKEAFEGVGGFTGKQHLGDFEMWHLLAMKYPVLLMPQGMAWYRMHGDQQMTDNLTDPYVPFKYLALRKELMSNPDCPLTLDERNTIIKKTDKEMARTILKTFVRRDFYNVKKMKDLCGFTPWEILKNI